MTISWNGIKGLVKDVLPTVSKVRREGSIPGRDIGTDDDLLGKACEWWAQDSYTNVKRYRVVKWFGKELFRIPYRETQGDIYWEKKTGLVRLVAEMQEAGIIPGLGSDSKIFESGCSVGRNLYDLQEKFGCHVTGLDISSNSLDLAKNTYWKGRDKFNFVLDNALTTDYFDKLEDNHFDLVLSYGHLMHIPFSDAKKRYVEHLKRIGKVFLLIEPFDENRSSSQLYHDGTYCLSLENWSENYNLMPYDPSFDMGDGMMVCYWNNASSANA